MRERDLAVFGKDERAHTPLSRGAPEVSAQCPDAITDVISLARACVEDRGSRTTRHQQPFDVDTILPWRVPETQPQRRRAGRSL